MKGMKMLVEIVKAKEESRATQEARQKLAKVTTFEEYKIAMAHLESTFFA